MPCSSAAAVVLQIVRGGVVAALLLALLAHSTRAVAGALAVHRGLRREAVQRRWRRVALVAWHGLLPDIARARGSEAPACTYARALFHELESRRQPPRGGPLHQERAGMQDSAAGMSAAEARAACKEGEGGGAAPRLTLMQRALVAISLAAVRVQTLSLNHE